MAADVSTSFVPGAAVISEAARAAPALPEEHLPGLDTLRAGAILLVIPRHAWEILHWPALKVFFGNFGWAGVDLFFLLSGFLIASQLLRSLRQTGHVGFRRFYFKRSLRILPCYLVVLLLYLVWPQFREAPNMQGVWRFLTFTMNLGVERGSWAYSHAWSLCVEEHFYLLFPLLVALSARWPKLVRPGAVVACVVLGGMVLRYCLWTSGAAFYPAIYRPTYCRLDGLTVGVSLALLRETQAPAWRVLVGRPWALCLVGPALAALGLWAFLPDSKGFAAAVLTFPLVSLGFGLLVAAAVAPGFWLSRCRIPGAKTVAALAYTLYLTHKQMIHLAVTIVDHPGDHPAQLVGVAVVLIGTASGLLHFGVERPCLKLRDQLLGRRALPASR